jgi:hypothetical protein
VIIGLGYKAGAGKDTAANFLCGRHGFRRISFAEPLKRAAAEIFGFNEYQLYDPQGKEETDKFWQITPRYALQWLGTDVMRQQFDQEIWVKNAKKRIEAEEGNVVVTDVRFPNEIAAIKEWGGLLVRVEREFDDRPGMAVSETKHSSEIALDNYDPDVWDFTLYNNGTVRELGEFVTEMYHHFREKDT